MAGTIVRELFARLGLDVDDAAFEAGEKAIGALSFRLAAAGAAVASFGVGLAVAVERTAAYAMESRNMAATSSIATQRFQQLAYAAQTAGVDAGTLRDAFLDISERALKASQGAQEYTRVFRALGVSVKDGSGKLKSTDAILMDVADSLARMKDRTKAGALASQLLGEQGARLLPLLNRGRDGIEKLAREADDLGLVLDERTTAAAAEFQANLQRAQGALRGFAYTIGGEAMPALSRLLERFTDWAKATRSAADGKTGKAVRFLGQAAQKAAQIVEALVWAVFQLAKSWKLLIMVGAAVGLTMLVLNGEMVAGAALAGVYALRGLAVAAAWLKAAAAQAAAAAPAVGLAAAFFLVALALEDVYTFLVGGDSMLGRFGPKWAKFLDEWTAENTGDNWLVTGFKAVVWLLSDITERLPASLKSWRSMIVDWAMELQALLGIKMDRAQVDKLLGATMKATNGGVGQRLEGTREVAGIWWNHAFGSSATPGASAQANAAQRAPVPTVAPTLNATVNVTAQTGANAEEIGGMVRQNIEDIWDTKMRESYVLAE